MIHKGSTPDNTEGFEPHPWQQTIIIVFVGLMLWFVNVLWTTGVHVQCESLSSFWVEPPGTPFSVSGAFTILLCMLIGWTLFELAIVTNSPKAERLHVAANVAAACTVLAVLLISVESTKDIDRHLGWDAWLQGQQILGVTPYNECKTRRRFADTWQIDNTLDREDVSHFAYQRLAMFLDGSLQLVADDMSIHDGEWWIDEYSSRGRAYSLGIRIDKAHDDTHWIRWDIESTASDQMFLTSVDSYRTHMRAQPNYAVRISRIP
ncbi:MAG: hypothetical protein AAGC71_15100 [Pseudomonadota bacterium]